MIRRTQSQRDLQLWAMGGGFKVWYLPQHHQVPNYTISKASSPGIQSLEQYRLAYLETSSKGFT